MPTRRDVLGTTALLGTGLIAGCVGGGGSADDSPTPTSTPTGTDDGPPGNGSGDGNASGDTRPEGTGGPAVTLASVAQRPELPVRPTVEVVDPVATADHPPRLRVSVENGADRRITLGEARAVVFEYVTSESGELITLPAGGDYPVEPGCWRLTEGIAVTTEYRTATLAPGEAVSSDLELYGAATGEDACLPVGEHRFESTYSVSTVDGATANGTGVGGTSDATPTAGTADATDAGPGGGASSTPAPVVDPDLPAEGTWGFTLLLE